MNTSKAPEIAYLDKQIKDLQDKKRTLENIHHESQITVEEKQIANLLHSFACDKVHPGDPINPGNCDWYYGSWSLDSKKQAIQDARQLIRIASDNFSTIVMNIKSQWPKPPVSPHRDYAEEQREKKLYFDGKDTTEIAKIVIRVLDEVVRIKWPK